MTTTSAARSTNPRGMTASEISACNCRSLEPPVLVLRTTDRSGSYTSEELKLQRQFFIGQVERDGHVSSVHLGEVQQPHEGDHTRRRQHNISQF